MNRISGHLQTYAWGVPGGLAPWRQDAGAATANAAAGAPEAELWFGAHVNGPSELVDDPAQTLRQAVDPSEVPLLVKLLAAARPLSIQIHPPTDQAERSFAAQEQDSTLPKLLADPLAKTEMLIAVEPFSVLQGFRDAELSAAILQHVGGAADAAAQRLLRGDVLGAIRYLLELSADELGPLCDRLPEAAVAAGLSSDAVDALKMVVRDYPGDPGVLVAALLDQRVLARGDAVYVPAGVVHAYVAGIGVEVMTASDNVLRLGLTPKAIAVDHALAALDPYLHPQPMQPEPAALQDGGTIRSYAPNGAPFTVEWVECGSVSAETGHYRLVLAVDGSTTVDADSEIKHLAQGQAAAILASEPSVRISTDGSAFIATDAQ